MMKFVIYFCDSLTIWLSLYLIGIILFESKPTKYLKLVICMIIFPLIIALLNLLDFEIGYGIIKILTTYLLQCIFYKLVFNKSISKCMVAALLYYLCMFISEIIIAIIASIILTSKSLDYLKNTIIINIIISVLGYIIAFVLRKQIKSLVKNINDYKKGLLIITIIILTTLTLILFKIPVHNWKFSSEFIVTMIILFGCCIIGLYLLKQKSDIEKTISKYKQEIKYSKVVSKLTAEYRKVNHEHKNELSVIRGMALKKDNDKLLDYIDILIEKKNNIKYKWSAELIYLPLDGLKSLINYKLVEMEDLNIKVILTISKDIKKMNFKKLDIKKEDNLYNIIGIYLDNAMEAALESKEKEVNIDIHKDKKNLVFIIGNTYKGKINLNKIDEYGYTTKGKNHGVGLNIVKTILENNNIFSQSRKIIDNYYVQELVIDLNKNKKTTK